MTYLACAPHRDAPPSAPRPTPPTTSDGSVWVDLETLAVDLHTGNVRPRASVAAPRGDASTVLTDRVEVIGDGTALRGLDRKTGAVLWTVREHATSSLQSFAEDGLLRRPEIVVGVDDRSELPAGTHRTLVGRATTSGRQIFRHPLPDADAPRRTSIRDGRILVVEGAATTTVVDVVRAAGVRGGTSLPRGVAQTFDEAVRWIDGFVWSSGDLVLSSDKRLARIELTSTSPEYVGTVVWSLPPLAGARGGGLLTGAADRSPNEEEKYICFFGYDPDRSTPVALALVEALARGKDGTSPRERFRGTVEPLGRACGPREVRLLQDGAAIIVIVACAEGAVVERRSLPDGTLMSRVAGRT